MSYYLVKKFAKSHGISTDPGKTMICLGILCADCAIYRGNDTCSILNLSTTSIERYLTRLSQENPEYLL